MNTIFSSTNSYRKGAWVLHMLRGAVGDAAFFQILADYRAAFEFSAATAQEFASVASASSGQDLSTFFDQWVSRAGNPVVNVYWRFDGSTGSVRVCQTGSPFDNVNDPFYLSVRFYNSRLCTDVAPVLVRSVVMSEDGQFCWHRGIDWAELNGVIDDAMAGEMTRGASTITMQTVKNLYLWHRPLGTVRKVIELPLAFYFDAVLSKKRIIEIYLNIAEWGPGIYGIEAAAQHHFGKSAKSLTARQAALLAVTLPNPIDRDPGKPGPGLKRLASLIQKRAANGASHVRCLE
jgi:monofunctional biosynthetic peptidoglycan transglycosylase